MRDNYEYLISDPNGINQHEIQIDDELLTDENAADDDEIENDNAIDSNDDSHYLELSNNINNTNDVDPDLINDDYNMSNDEDNASIDVVKRDNGFGLLVSDANNDLVSNDKDNYVDATVTRPGSIS